jgi:hypothetical protein
MKCDAPSGCGTASFGDDVPLAEGFSMSAFIPAMQGDTVSVHVTPFTDLAARRAEADPDGLDPTTVANANDVVRQTFGLPGDITAIRPVDLTDPVAVAAADTASQQVAVLAAGILEAVQQTDAVVNGGASFETALDTFADTFASDGGLVQNDTAASEDLIVSLDDILAGAGSVVDAVETDAEAAGIDVGLDDVAAGIEVAEMGLSDTPSDDPNTDIEPLDTVLAARLDQGKAMISDLRDLTASAQLEELEVAADTFGNSLELAFSEQVDLVTGVVTNDLGVVTEALGLAVDAMSRALDAASEDEALTSFTVDAGELAPNSPEITVAIDGSMLEVDQDIDGVAVALNGEIDLTISEVEEGNTESEDLDGTIAISGTAENDDFSIAIGDESQASVMYTEVETFTETGETSTLTVPTLTLNLMVTITASQAEGAPTFTGSIDVNLVGFESTEAYEFIAQDDGSSTNSFVDTLTFSSAELTLSGAFSDTTGNSIEAMFTIDLNNENGFVLEVEELFAWDPVLGANTFTETESEETAENFVAASATVGLTAAFPGIDDSVQVTLSVERTGVEDGSAELNIQFAGKSLTVVGNTIDEVITITNQGGVVMVIAEDDNGELTGSIVVEDEEVATIEENEDGVVIIRYTDGTFETFA